MVEKPARSYTRRLGSNDPRVGAMRAMSMTLRLSSKLTVTALVLGAALIVGAPAEGAPQTTSSTFAVRTQVHGGCTFTTNDMLFQVPLGMSISAKSQTTFRVICPAAGGANPNTLPVRFTFEPLAPHKGEFRMGGGPNAIPYRLCNDAACTEVYAAGVPGPAVPVIGNPYTYTLYGELLPFQNVGNGVSQQRIDVILTY